MHKGLSVVISSVLIIATLTALAATSGIFFTNTFSAASENADEANQQLAECRDKSLVIDSASFDNGKTEVTVRSRRGEFTNVSIITRPSLTTNFTSIESGNLVTVNMFTSDKPELVRASSQNCGISKELEVSS